MRTTLDLPEDLLKQAKKAARVSTKTQTVILGLEELIRLEKLRKFLSLKGKFPDFYIDIDASRGRSDIFE